MQNRMLKFGISLCFSIMALVIGAEESQKIISQYSADLSKNYTLNNDFRSKICLNGVWKVSLAGKLTAAAPTQDSDYGYVVVPSSWMHTTDFPIYGTAKFKGGPFNGKGKWNGKPVRDYPYAWYVRDFTVPADWQNKEIFLKLDRVTISGTIFVNGKEVGSQNEREEKSWDITSLVKFGEVNKLEVRVTAFLDKTIKLFLGAEMTTTTKARANLRGITQDVWLVALPKTATIKHVFMSPSFRKKELRFDVTIDNPAKKSGPADLKISVCNDNDKKEVKTFTHNVKLTGEPTQVVTFTQPWNDPVLWETDKPHLYQAVATLDIDGKAVDQSFPETFGFREVWVDGRNVMMNGKPIHFRSVHIGSHDAFVNTAANNAQKKINFYRDAGYNSLQLGSEGVWRDGHSAQFYDEILDIADRQGLPVFVPMYPINGLDMANPEIAAKWQQTVRDFINKHRNHPSIMMWSLNFNYLGYPWDMNPHVMGTDYAPPSTILFLGDKRKQGADSEAFVASVDPSRESYHHAGGNYGKMSTSNFYPAWLPLQEREDYFSKWATKGVKPFFAVELGLPSSLDFMRARIGNYNTVRYSEVLEAEYGASYLGPKAYELQSDQYLNMISSNATDKTTAGADKYNVNGAYWWGYRLTLHEPFKSIMEAIYPTYLRTWRTYGVTGYSPNSGAIEIIGKQWQPWHGVKGKYKYEDLTRPGAKPGTYFVPNGKITDTGKKYARAQQPVLVYVGGCKENGFSAKDHAYYAGEKIEKQLVVVNQSRQDLNVTANWQLQDKMGKAVAEGKEQLAAKAGHTVFKPFTITAPAVDERTEYDLTLSVDGVDKDITSTWDLQLEIFPKKAFSFSGKIALFDPVGETSKALKALAVPFETFTAATDLSNVDAIIIGRKALPKADALMTNILKAVNNGKTLICFSQPDLTVFGLRTHQRGVRRAFIIDNENDLVKGLKDADFENWRGHSTMTEAYPKPPMTTQENYPTEPWKWGNRGVICSYMIEKPQTGNGTAILETEFDLGYTPLVEFNEGKGRIVLSQLDLSERVGVDPVATLVFERLLTQAVTKPADTGAVFACNEAVKQQLEAMKTVLSGDLTNSKVAVLKGQAPDSAMQAKLVEFVKNGGTLILVGQKALKSSSWLPVSFKLKTKRFYRAKPLSQSGVMQGISMSDLFIKDRVRGKIVQASDGVQVLASPGIIAEAKLDQGKVVVLAVDPENYKNSKITPERMNRIHTKLTRVLAALIKNSNGSFESLGKKFIAGDNLKNIPLPSQWRFTIDPKNRGRRKRWYKTSFNDSKWQLLNVPGYWENQGVNGANSRFPKAKKPYNGYAWYRCKVVIPEAYKGKKLKLMLGAVDDMDTTYFNGKKIGVTGTETPNYYAFVRDYPIPDELIKFGKENIITVKVFDNYGDGGIVGPKLYIHTANTNTYPYMNKKTPFNPYKLKRW